MLPLSRLLAPGLLALALAVACGDGYDNAAPSLSASAGPTTAFNKGTPAAKITSGATAGSHSFSVVHADGSTVQISTDGAPFSLVASPDRTRIAFEATEGAGYALYVVNADGSGMARLTDVPGQEYPFPPVWSPGGTRIAFEVDRSGGGFLPGDAPDIFVIGTDGSGRTNLTTNPAPDDGPSWSPDGTRIAFATTRDGNSEIYVMNADGSGQTNLSNNPASDRAPAWSPDGKHIAFVSDRDGNLEIYVMNSDGSAPANLSRSQAVDFGSVVGHFPPVWSPDSQLIAFLSDRDGNVEIYTVAVDGSSQTRITDDPDVDFGPAWSPDGERIAFSSGRAGPAIYIVRRDGSTLTRIAITGNGATFLLW